MTAAPTAIENIEPLLTGGEIESRVQAMAERLAKDMDSSWVVAALMDGALMFAADIMRGLYWHGINPQFENLTLSSYGDDIQSAGIVKVEKTFSRDITGRNVLILDDVFETGLTLARAIELAKSAGAAQVKSCVFAYKDGYAKADMQPDYYGWDAPDVFLVGYGMDFKGQYRGLPFIADLLP